MNESGRAVGSFVPDRRENGVPPAGIEISTERHNRILRAAGRIYTSKADCVWAGEPSANISCSWLNKRGCNEMTIAIVVIVLSAMALWGNATHHALLASLIPGSPITQPIAAIGLIIAAIQLVSYQSKVKWSEYIFAAATFHLLGLSIILALLHYTGASVFPAGNIAIAEAPLMRFLGEPAIPMTATIALFGMAGFLRMIGETKRQGLAVLCVFIMSTIAMIGHLIGSPTLLFYVEGRTTAWAFPAALCSFLLSGYWLGLLRDKIEANKNVVLKVERKDNMSTNTALLTAGKAALLSTGIWGGLLIIIPEVAEAIISLAESGTFSGGWERGLRVAAGILAIFGRWTAKTKITKII